MKENRKATLRPGVTLIELLIVLTILLIVTAAAIPLMVPATQNRRMREASRLVSSYFAGARSRAVELNRPVGVMIQRFDGRPYSMTLSYVEVPPTYSGDNASDGCTIVAATSPSYPPSGQDVTMGGYIPVGYTATWFTLTVTTDNFTASLIRVGDTIQFGGRGASCVVLGPDVGQDRLLNPMSMNIVRDGVIDKYEDPMTKPPQRTLDVAYLTPPGGSTPAFPWTAAPTPNVGYRITRQPTSSSIAAPLQLPEGAVIDLLLSGMGRDPLPDVVVPATPTGQAQQAAHLFFPMPNPVVWDPVILFTPSGDVSYVSMSRGLPSRLARPTGTIFLLLGRRELMPDISKSGFDENFCDPAITNAANLYLQNFWISIGYQTGHVAVSETAVNPVELFTTSDDGNPFNPMDMTSYPMDGKYQVGERFTDKNGNFTLDPSVATSRVIAQQAQSAGGP
jgi:prepilin-type N-terminal cleavage/methylation domain-containing protein